MLRYDECYIVSDSTDFHKTDFTLQTLKSILSCANATDNDPTPGFYPGPLAGYLVAVDLGTHMHSLPKIGQDVPSVPALMGQLIHNPEPPQRLPPVPSQQPPPRLPKILGMIAAQPLTEFFKSSLMSAMTYSSRELSYITVVNMTSCFIRLNGDYAFKGEVIAKFQWLYPAITTFGSPLYSVGAFISDSGWTTGSASAIELVSESPKFRVVVAAARPIWGTPTTLVSTDQGKKIEDLANENDSSGVGPDKVVNVQLPGTNIVVDASVESEGDGQGKYCHVRVLFRYA